MRGRSEGKALEKKAYVFIDFGFFLDFLIDFFFVVTVILYLIQLVRDFVSYGYHCRNSPLLGRIRCLLSKKKKIFQKINSEVNTEGLQITIPLLPPSVDANHLTKVRERIV